MFGLQFQLLSLSESNPSWGN